MSVLSQETIQAMINASSSSTALESSSESDVKPTPEATKPNVFVANGEKIKQIEHKLLVILMVRAGISGLGTISGWIYAHKTGGGFWRYVGFGLMGGMAFGTLSFIATIPTYSKLDAELKNLK